jgi:lysophospholipase L1-like esterase
MKKDISIDIIYCILILILSILCLVCLLLIGRTPKEVTKTVTKTITEEVLEENIVFFGDSITYRYDIKESFPNHYIVNKGINGNTTQNLLDRIDADIIEYNPSKVFLLIGVNDLSGNVDKETVVENIKKIIETIEEKRPKAKIYVESILPINRKRLTEEEYPIDEVLTNDLIKETNELIKELCKEKDLNYINLYDKLLDDDGNLKEEYTVEGQHLTSEGYEVITNILKEYVDE